VCRMISARPTSVSIKGRFTIRLNESQDRERVTGGDDTHYRRDHVPAADRSPGVNRGAARISEPIDAGDLSPAR
jgi:hypothetical protein